LELKYLKMKKIIQYEECDQQETSGNYDQNIID